MKITRSDNTALTLLLTNETCFNCFGTRSSDANRNNKKTTKLPWKFKSYATSLDPPPPPSWWERGVAKMAPVPDGEMTTLSLILRCQ